MKHARVLRFILGVFLLAGHAGQPAWAQPPSSPTQISLAGQIELARLVDMAAQRLRLNIDYDAGALKGTVTLRLDGGLTDQELWELTNRVLAARGFTTVRQQAAAEPGGPARLSYSVVKLTDAPTLAPVTERGRDVPAASGPAPGFQSLVFRLQHRSPRDLIDQLNKIGGRGAGGGGIAAGFSPVGDTGMIVVSDLTTRLEQVASLIDLLDVPEARTVVEEIPATNITAPQLVTLMNQLAAKREAVSGHKLPGDALAGPDGNAVLVVAPESALPAWRELVRTLDRREPVETVAYTPRYFPAKEVSRLIDQSIKRPASGPGAAAVDDRWNLVVDDLTGSLLVTATPSQHESIRALVDRLDQAPAGVRRPMRTFTIKNRSVDEIVSVIEQLVNSGGLSAAAPVDEPAAASSNGAQLAAVIPLPPPPTTSPPASLPDSRSAGSGHLTKASIAAGRPDDDALTLTVDRGTSTIIAVGDPRILEQVETLIKALDIRQPQVMLEVLLVTLTRGQTLDLGVELEKLEMSGDTLIRVSSLFGLGSRGSGGDRIGPENATGFTGVVLSPGDFSIILRALETLNDGRSLSMPTLLVGNNEQATLDSVVQQPFASVNASNTVSTTSFGGTQDAGTVVTIQPQIAEGDHLLLQYSVSLSSFLGPASSPTLPPPRQQNRVQSVATIPDGFTVVVGGIEIENKSQATSQIPLLGSIPIIGEAFKNRALADNRSRFYVFIRANILRHGGFEDLKYLSETQAAEARVEDGWPQLKPRVIR